LERLFQVIVSQQVEGAGTGKSRKEFLRVIHKEKEETIWKEVTFIVGRRQLISCGE